MSRKGPPPFFIFGGIYSGDMFRFLLKSVRVPIAVTRFWPVLLEQIGPDLGLDIRLNWDIFTEGLSEGIPHDQPNAGVAS
jgi:hypothetical protein